MSEYIQIKTSDMERIRLALASLTDVLALYPAKIDPLSNAEKDKRLAEGICLWCGTPTDGKKKVRGCHEYCVTKAIAQATEDSLMMLNRLMPASKGGRPIKIVSEMQNAKLIADAKASRKNNNH